MFLVWLFMHGVFLFSIFDIYFQNSIVRNVAPYQPQHDSVADRLVVFVADAVRADSFANYTAMSYLRSIANTHGRWGVSSTQAPTESYPGHLAIFAGFYEDSSAVIHLFQANRVDFDSVFNHSAYTWYWGTWRNVDKVFTKGIGNKNFFSQWIDERDSHGLSFDERPTALDSWVFEKVKVFFNKAKSNNTLKEKMRSKKIVYFVYLTGTDLSGHKHKPKSQFFLKTLRNVDEGIEKTEKTIREFYSDDGKTMFLMTSDHGMTDGGSHGSGDDHETQTPYVLWGAGVQQAKEGPEDRHTKDMSFNHRLDINQADLAPLMSTILSIPVPVNSIGKLPVDLLNMTIPNKAKAMYSHSRQLASQYHRKKLNVEANAISLLYKPFDPFSTEKYEKIIEFTEKLLLTEEYEKLIHFSEEITQLSLAGLTYYQNYYQRPLLVLVTMSFIGWIACLLKVLLEQKVNTEVESVNLKRSIILGSHLFLNVIFVLLCFFSFFCVYAQKLPIQYHIYFLMPIFLWWNAIPSLVVWVKALRLFRSQKMNYVWIKVLCYSLGSVALGLSFTYRWMLSIPLMGMGLWPLFSSLRSCLSTPMLIAWPASCAMLSCFSFVPAVWVKVLIELVVFAGLLWLIVMAVYSSLVLLPLYHRREENRSEVMLTVIQIALLIFSLLNIYVQQSKRYDQGTPVLYFYRIMSWTTAVIALLLPMASSKRLICRLMTINTSILIFYLLMSIAHEGIFLVTLNLNVMCWVLIEFRLLHLGRGKIIDCAFDKSPVGEERTKRSISSDDFRRAFFFVAYLVLAFFGTGSIKTLNTFYGRWVTCFITSFERHITFKPILLKILMPFLSVACSFRGVQHLTEAPAGPFHIIVLIYSNIMGIQSLYYVRDNTGSYLEMGTSVTHFAMVQVITLLVVIINQMAKVLTNFNVFNFISILKLRAYRQEDPSVYLSEKKSLPLSEGDVLDVDTDM